MSAKLRLAAALAVVLLGATACEDVTPDPAALTGSPRASTARPAARRTPAARPATKPPVRATTRPTKATVVATRTPAPVRTTVKPRPLVATTCGAPANPWGYNFCGRGSVISRPPSAFCDYFDCIASFWESTNGYVMQCDDGMFSHSGGRQGSCSHHGGNDRPLLG
ncbi:MAG TPA: hypothetical protein VNQ77_15785 [Frankiaceae bacterium]|nr:hypothetical protein [Frankiaceae bacterium]